jgi:hypothetical protein
MNVVICTALSSSQFRKENLQRHIILYSGGTNIETPLWMHQI